MQPLLVRLGLNAKDFNAGFLEARKNLEQVRKNTDQLSKSMQNMNKIAKLAFSAWGIYNVREGLQSIIRYVGEVSIELDRMKRSMNAATGSISLGAYSIKFLQQESQRLGLQFRDQIKGFQQLAAAAKGTSLTYKDVREVWLGISEASTVMQLSAEQNKYALYALQQMISKGVVTMEELRRQLGDQIPGAFQIAARAMGVTTQELIKMVSTGNLISEEFVPKFAKQLRKEMAGSVEDASQSIYANINRLKNEFYSLGNDVAQSSGGIETFNEHLKEFIEYLKDPDTKQAIENIGKNFVILAEAIIKVGKAANSIADNTFLGKLLVTDFDKTKKNHEDLIKVLNFGLERYQNEIDKTREKIKQIEKDMNGWRGSLMGKDPFLEMIEKEKSKLDELIDRMDAVKRRRDDLLIDVLPRLKGKQVPDDIYGDTTEWELNKARRQEIIKNFEESTLSSEAKAIAKLNKDFEVTKKQLENLSVTSEEINELQNLYAKALNKFAQKRKSILDKWSALASGNKENKALVQLQREHDRDKKKLIDLKASAEELARLENDYHKKINNIIDDNKKKRESLISRWETKGTALKQDSELAKLKNQYENTKKQLENLNATAEEIAKLENAYNRKITDVLNDNSRSRKDIIDKWKELSADLSDEERRLLELERKYIEARNKLIDMGGKASELAELKAAFESAKFRATEYFRSYKEFIENIKGITKDTFKEMFKGNFDSWQDMIDRMRDAFLDMLADLALQALTKKITLNVGTSGTNAFGGTGFTNLFGKSSYNIGASALIGASLGASSQNQSYLSSAAGSAMTGYAIGGPYGALGGAIGSVAGKWLFGDKKSTSTSSTPAWYDVSSGENKNKPWVGSIGAPELNIRGQFPYWSPYSYQPDYNWFLNPAGTSYKSIESINELQAKKREISIQFSDILTKLPDEFASDIISQAMPVIGGIWSTWELPPGTDMSYIAEKWAFEYNRAITDAISDDIQSYLQTSVDWELLDHFTKTSLLKPVFGGTSNNLQVKNLTNVEDIVNLLNYLEQINIVWRDISTTTKQLVGESVNYEIGINNINDQFDQMIKTLRDLGFAQERITEIESQRQDALNFYASQMLEQRNNILEQWQILSGQLSKLEVERLNLLNQYNDSLKQLEELGASTEETAQLFKYYSMALSNINNAADDTGAIERLADKIADLLDQWRISSGVLTDYESALLDLQNQYESAKESLISFGASTEQLSQLEGLYETSIGNLIDSFTDGIADSFKNINNAWSAFFNNIMNDLSPVQSSAYLGQKLSSLYGAANTEEGINNLLEFVQSEYLPFMKAYGESDYNTIWENIRDLTGNITFNGQTIGGIDYDLMGSTIGEYVSTAMSNDNSKIIIQIGDRVLSEILLSELKNNNPELISEIRRVING